MVYKILKLGTIFLAGTILPIIVNEGLGFYSSPFFKIFGSTIGRLFNLFIVN
jgi:hypothetical protein